MARFRLELGPVPLHHQVYLDLKAALDVGEWQPGDRLPTERDLAARYAYPKLQIGSPEGFGSSTKTRPPSNSVRVARSFASRPRAVSVRQRRSKRR